MFTQDQHSGAKINESPPPPYTESGNRVNASSSAPMMQNVNQPMESSTNGDVVEGNKLEDDLTEDRMTYPLHECVYRGDVKQLSALIRAGHDLSKVDPHGNSALHLAVMLGKHECVHLLCAHGAPVKIKNKQGWSPIAEAIRYIHEAMVLNHL